MKCPRCGVDLKNNINLMVSGVVVYTITLGVNDEIVPNMVSFEEDENIAEYYCANCGATLDITTDEVKEILKGKK